MRDDLVKRLRERDAAGGDYCTEWGEAADCIEQLEEENGVLIAASIRLSSRIDLDSDHYVDRIEKLEAALRFYANDENYRQVWDDQFRTWVTYVLSDNGRIARKALEGKDD